jgi:prophage regulatory protein
MTDLGSYPVPNPLSQTHVIVSNTTRCHVSTPNFDQLPDSGFIRQRQLITAQIVPFSPTTLWRRVAAGRFPKPIKISHGITAWHIAEVRLWLQNPAAYKTQADIKPSHSTIERSRRALR